MSVIHRQVMLDTETTGIGIASGNRIVEIGAVELIGRQLTGKTYHTYLNPDRDSDPGALKVHGLTTQFLQDKPHFIDVVEGLLFFIAGAEVVIHNAPFDVSFLTEELRLIEREPFREHCDSVVDSLLMARRLHPGKRNSLDALCERYNIDNSQRVLHGALSDSYLLVDVYLAMTRGQEVISFTSETEVKSDVGAQEKKIIDIYLLLADKNENSLHEKYLDSLGESCVWRQPSKLITE